MHYTSSAVPTLSTVMSNRNVNRNSADKSPNTEWPVSLTVGQLKPCPDPWAYAAMPVPAKAAAVYMRREAKGCD